ncbi:transposase [Streptomyces sp. NPDC057908]|uniref:transposase n=1 Tax=Streptomyces sp. NPDC057908 TaxID=3346276 RepID=UPI0036EC2E06
MVSTRTSGRPVAHVARGLGIHKEAMRGQVRQAEVDQGSRPDPLTTAERTELTQLRKEIAAVPSLRSPESSITNTPPAERGWSSPLIPDSASVGPSNRTLRPHPVLRNQRSGDLLQAVRLPQTQAVDAALHRVPLETRSQGP